MAELRVNPTRMEMKRIQTRYQTARKGHKLLKDKRDELMKQFLDVVREDKLLRERVEEALGKVYQSFTVASAVSSPKMLEEAMIFGRAGDLQKAEQAFNQYYDSKAQEYRGHEGWKSYGYLRVHLDYLAELADKLHLTIRNPI